MRPPDLSTTSTTVATALERNVRAVTLRPAVGQGTATTRVRLRDGLACDITDGTWSLTAGMAEKYGGINAGPNPGVLGRAAFGACLALSYAMWAARLGVAIDALDIEVQADYDVRGELGVSDDTRPGYSQVRYVVSIESAAPAEDVMRVLDTADRYGSWLDNLRNPVDVRREVHIQAPSQD
jgi:uncharacterized OsmC-like protein